MIGDACKGAVVLPQPFSMGQHRITGQGDSARDFGTSESMKNVGILDVFPIFKLHDWGKRFAETRSSHCAVLP